MTRITAVPATLSFDEVSRDAWDVVVVGAGVAGAMAALEVSRLSLRVLLVDRNVFPRWKVCGCCVNQAALQMLDAAGLARLPGELGARKLREFRLACRGQTASVALGGGVAISREQLDAALIQSAIDSGADFLDATHALVRPDSPVCHVQLKQNDEARTVACKVAIVASGLGARCFAGDAGDTRESSRRSRIGAATIVDVPGSDYADGVIHMACDRSGYAGIVRVEDGRLEIASALDSDAIKQWGGVGPAAARVIESSGLPPIPGLEQQAWHGTAKLTQRRRQVFGEGYLVVGDAAGYIEPFTGEGIAWALATGRSVADFAWRAAQGDAAHTGRAWSRHYHRLVRRRMLTCRALSFLLRRPRLVSSAIWTLARRPSLAAPVERLLNAPYFTGGHR